ncbi:DciA family protein [Streptomyces sp. NBC_00057]|uniref:DciA family protein n=1 Tax=Streptomyces sp. NBC_00057 TaxID=2975634 RepID=UPI002F91A09D
MTTESELSGVDLARQALLAAREAAKRNGATSKKPKRRTTTVVRRDGREPLGLGSAIGRMMTERGMVAPAAGGSVLADFDAILAAAVPELASRVRAVAFDAETGRLDVVPDAPAVGTKLRWSAPKLIAAANERVSGANVRALHVLAPAPVKASPATAAAAPAPQPTESVAPVERRTPPEGYRRAIEAHRQAAVPSRVDPGIAQAVERQNRAMRELSHRAFPEPTAVPDGAPAPIDRARVQRRRQAAATEAAALRRARAERTQLTGSKATMRCARTDVVGEKEAS